MQYGVVSHGDVCSAVQCSAVECSAIECIAGWWRVYSRDVRVRGIIVKRHDLSSYFLSLPPYTLIIMSSLCHSRLLIEYRVLGAIGAYTLTAT